MTRICMSGRARVRERMASLAPWWASIVGLWSVACGRTQFEMSALGIEDGSAPHDGTTTSSSGGSLGGSCENGLGGRACEVAVDICAPNPCANGGGCVKSAAGPVCSCALGFGGERCTESRSFQIPPPTPCITAGVTAFVVDDISGDGHVLVGGCSISGNGIHSFSWTFEEGFDEIGPADSHAWRTNRDGSTFAGALWSANRAATWRAPWTTASVVAPADSVAFGMSGDGAVIAGVYAESPRRASAFRFSEDEGFEALGSLREGETSMATAVSEDGTTIVGDADVPNGVSPFYWTRENGMHIIDLPNGRASAVSEDGSVIFGNYTPAGESSDHLFRWTRTSGVTDLGACGSIMRLDVDASGSTAVAEGGPGLDGLIWDARHGMRPLIPTLRALGADLPAFPVGLTGVAISDDGTRIAVAGFAQDATTSWLVGLPR